MDEASSDELVIGKGGEGDDDKNEVEVLPLEMLEEMSSKIEEDPGEEGGASDSFDEDFPRGPNLDLLPTLPIAEEPPSLPALPPRKEPVVDVVVANPSPTAPRRPPLPSTTQTGSTSSQPVRVASTDAPHDSSVTSTRTNGQPPSSAVATPKVASAAVKTVKMGEDDVVGEVRSRRMTVAMNIEQYKEVLSQNDLQSKKTQQSLKGIRGLVSKKKKRYIDGKYDLDLAYITDRLIAMGFPSEGREGIIRNPMGKVVEFFEERHAGHYKVYNLCSERTYKNVGFRAPVKHMGFDDHNPPTLELLEDICKDVAEWLDFDQRNVAALHCLADDHEILTNMGFMGMSSVHGLLSNDDFRVAGFDPASGTMVFEKPLAFIFNPPKRQSLVQISQPLDGLSLCVTDGHEMYVSLGGQPYCKVPAATLLHSRAAETAFMTAAPEGVFDEQQVSDETVHNHPLFWLAGYCLGGGVSAVSGDCGSIAFCYTTAAQRLAIEQCVSKCAVSLYTVDATACILSGGPAKRLAALLGLQKWWRVLNVSREALHAALAGVRCFLSPTNEERRGEMLTRDAEVRDAVVELFLFAGIGVFFEQDAEGLFHLCESGSRVRLSGSGAVSSVPYVGPTWCVNMPSGFIFARRSSQVSSVAIRASVPVLMGNCKAGKGRTGTVICAYLSHRYMNKGVTSQKALDFFAERRTHNKKGVTIASQIRWVHYYYQAKVMGLDFTKSCPLLLSKIVLHGGPNLDGKNLTETYFVLTSKASDVEFTSKGKLRIGGATEKFAFDVRCIVDKDVKLQWYRDDPKEKLEKKKRLFHVWFNTHFVKDNSLTLALQEVDGIKKTISKYPPTFAVEFLFETPE